LCGNGNNATLINGTSYSSSIGGTMVFDGINDYAQVSTGLSRTSNTVSIWFNHNSGNGGLFETTQSNGQNRTGSPYMFIGAYSGLNKTYNDPSGYSPTAAYTLNTWSNLTVCNSGSTQTIYLNGVYQTTKSIYSFSGYNDKINIGSAYPGWFYGKISMVHAYNRALTVSEITTNFDTLKSRYGL
jgi:hypothetical protein